MVFIQENRLTTIRIVSFTKSTCSHVNETHSERLNTVVANSLDNYRISSQNANECVLDSDITVVDPLR